MMQCILLVAVAAAVMSAHCGLAVRVLPPPTTAKATIAAAATTLQATPPPPPTTTTTTTTTQSAAASSAPTTADNAQPLSECANPVLSMSLRSARNSTGLWTDEVRSAAAVEQGGGRLPAGYRLDAEHSASYSCGGTETTALTVTLTAPVIPLPAAGKL